MKKIFLLLLFIILFTACEKDDICDATTNTTPRLVIEFYDNLTIGTIPTTKNINNLLIVDQGTTNAILFNGVSKIRVPLKVDNDITGYRFIINYDAASTTPVFDDLQFNCNRNNIFVSRACGFKTTFTLATVLLNSVVLTPTSSGSWIQKIQVIQTNINNENETHIKIYF